MVVAVVAGALFALGLIVSGMADPANVTGFLDVTGDWNPALALVMGGAIAVHAPFVRLARARRAPLYDAAFHWPQRRRIDPALVVGAGLFGIGWGLSGYCPGPALVSAGTGTPAIFTFLLAMFAGIAATRAAKFCYRVLSRHGEA
ncbi:MAG: DUF6691 family protein [Kofleriaceae bacterium]|nr:DUF6691 family protein [Kofleriaceae bacterium]